MICRYCQNLPDWAKVQQSQHNVLSPLPTGVKNLAYYNGGGGRSNPYGLVSFQLSSLLFLLSKEGKTLRESPYNPEWSVVHSPGESSKIQGSKWRNAVSTVLISGQMQFMILFVLSVLEYKSVNMFLMKIKHMWFYF